MSTDIHIMNPDGKQKPRNFWLVQGRALDREAEKLTTVTATFDNKDAAVRCAQAWALRAKIKKVQLLKGEVEWSTFEPTSKADTDIFNKIAEANKA